MISAWGIRKFLLRQPKPTAIHLTVRGVVTEMTVTRGQSLSKIADSIHAVAPEVIELFDGDGKLVRALRPDSDVDPTSEQPKIPTALSSDPETARLNHFASLVARAYEFSVTIAFTKLVDIVERMDARTEAIEARLERTESAYRRTLDQQLRDAQEEALAAIEQAAENQDGEGNGNDLVKQMMGAFMSGASRGDAKRKAASSNGANGQSNGKA